MESNPKDLDEYFENVRQACNKMSEFIEELMNKLTILEDGIKSK